MKNNVFRGSLLLWEAAPEWGHSLHYCYRPALLPTVRSSLKAFSSPTSLSVEGSLSLDSLSKRLRRVLELKKERGKKYIPLQKKTKLEQELLHLLAL